MCRSFSDNPRARKKAFPSQNLHVSPIVRPLARGASWSIMTAARDFPLITMPSLCVIARGGKCGSAVCERICPADAIRVEPPESSTPGPRIDVDSCERCYLCVTACTSGAIQDGDLSTKLEAAIRRRLRNTHELVFRCAARHDGDAPHPGTPEIADDPDAIVVPCLGVVSESSLLFASTCGAASAVLDNRLCAGCSWRRGTVLARRAASHAQSFLRLVGRELPVRFLAVEPPSTDRREPGMTRRQFFGSVRGDDGVEPSENPALVRAPRERLLLNRALHQLTAPAAHEISPGEGSLWAVAATDACDCCGACAALCPAGAIQFRESSREATLVSYPVLCTGCSLCLERCPRRALVWHSPATTDRFVDREGHDPEAARIRAITLAHRERGVCESCSRPMESWRRGRLCADCHLKQAITSSFAATEGAI